MPSKPLEDSGPPFFVLILVLNLTKDIKMWQYIDHNLCHLWPLWRLWTLPSCVTVALWGDRIVYLNV